MTVVGFSDTGSTAVGSTDSGATVNGQSGSIVKQTIVKQKNNKTEKTNIKDSLDSLNELLPKFTDKRKTVLDLLDMGASFYMNSENGHFLNTLVKACDTDPGLSDLKDRFTMDATEWKHRQADGKNTGSGS